MNSGLDLGAAPLRNAQALKDWGRTLAVAPHPDDESLGCGGTLALLADLQLPVLIVFVSDGAASHPNSLQWAAPRLRDLREAEARAALDVLGVGGSNARFLRLPDGAVPRAGEADFAAALQQVEELVADFGPQTVLVPWRRDPHRDHRASWQLFAHALRWREPDAGPLRWLEYLVWAFERGAPDEWPQQGEARAWRLDIAPVLKRKTAAIQAHRSQVTRLIDDDPQGFWLSPEVIAHFQTPHETWIAPLSCDPRAGSAAAPQFEKHPDRS